MINSCLCAEADKQEFEQLAVSLLAVSERATHSHLIELVKIISGFSLYMQRIDIILSY